MSRRTNRRTCGALVEVDDAAHDPDQVRHRRLEQLVAREGLERVHQRLVVVARRLEPEMSDDALDLVPQHRNLARALAVGRRSPQADEAALAGHPAARVEGLDADVVEVGRAVDGRDRVRLGDDQRLRRTREGANLAGQHDGPGLVPGARAHQAEAGACRRNQPVARRAALQPVFPVAEEREVVLVHPLEQRLRLADVARVAAQPGRAEFGRGLARLRAHLPPVAGRGADVVERLPDVPFERGEAHRVRLAVDLDQLPGLEARAVRVRRRGTVR